MMTLSNIDALRILEPCGNGCPKPVLVMEHLQIERMSQVGGGRHMRLRLRHGQFSDDQEELLHRAEQPGR